MQKQMTTITYMVHHIAIPWGNKPMDASFHDLHISIYGRDTIYAYSISQSL
jgi:hypothetical protein